MRLSISLLAATLAICAWAGAQTSPILAEFAPGPKADKRPLDSGTLQLDGELKDIATVVAGEKAAALRFVGKSEGLQLKSHWAIDNMLRRFTLSMWIKPQSLPKGDIAYILAKRPGWWILTPFALGLGRDGRLRAVCNDGSDHWIASADAVALDEWRHVAVTFEEGKLLALYVDGVLQPETTTAGRLRGNAEPLALGYVKGGDFPGGDYQPYRGDVAKLRIFPVALDAGQVVQEMNGQLPTRPAETGDYPKRGLDAKDVPAMAAPSGDDPLDCEIVFDQQPKARGMWFDASDGEAREVEVDGAKTWCRVAGTAMGVPYGRSLKLLITDARFKNGKMPSCDIEIVYLANAWAGVHVRIDAKNGGREIGNGWQSKKWMTLKLNADDAFFAARDHGNSDRDMMPDGFDLRINGYNQDLLIRSVKIIGHDRSGNVNWKRLLRLSGMETETGLLTFERKADQPIRYQFDNLALKDAKLSWTWSMRDYSGKTLQRASGDLRIAGESKGAAEVKVDASQLPLGPYLMQLDAVVDDNGTAQPLVSRAGKLGIISDTQIGKANAGEFLYGLANTVDTPLLRDWCKLLGVDIIREGRINLDDPEGNQRFISEYAANGIQVMPMIDPPQEGSPTEYHNGIDPAKRATMLQEQGAKLESFARTYAGKVKYYELGNEPDLRFFYHGPIEEYADSFKTMRQYLKKGDPDAVVMTGGLCFFGEEGDARARKLLSVLGAQDVDSWAYHGHGLGVAAERTAFERIRAALATAGDGREKKPYIETESGLAVDPNSPGELLQQARTCIQKMAYAQSNGSPTFFWFSLLIGPDDGWYTTTEGFGGMEPRPAALAYRSMVERLRHMRFQALLDLKRPEVEGYLFEGPGGSKTLIAWSNRAAVHDVSIRLDSPAASEVVQSDMFGNAQAARLRPGGVANLTIGVDPLFLSWRSTGAVADVRTEESMLAAGVSSPVFAGATRQAHVIVRNSSTETLRATLEVHAVSRLPVSAKPSTLDVEVAPGESRRVPVELQVGEASRPLRLPRWWRVFPNIQADKVDMASLTAIPAELPGKNGPVRGTDVLSNGHIDINRIGGASVGKEPAVLMTHLRVAHDTLLQVGSGSDWWMAWYLNGERIYDTLETGNGAAASTLKHTFNLPLKAGDNTVAVQVLSGLAGWALSFGTDKEVGLRDSAGIDPDRLVCRLVMDGTELTQQVIPLDIEQSIPAGAAIGDDLEAWRLTEPVAVMDGASVTNLHQKFPEASKWYKGEGDLSATAWINPTSDRVIFAVAVKDDKFVAPAAGELADGDAIELRVTDDSDQVLLQMMVGLVEGKVVAQQGSNVQGIETALEQEGDLTLYRITAPRALIGAAIAKLHVSVMDNDEGYLKQLARIKNRSDEEGVCFRVH